MNFVWPKTPFDHRDESPSVLDGKVVLVTGGTGSFGRAFVQRALKTNVAKVIVFSRDELKQSEMQKDPRFDDDRMRYFIGDVRDTTRLYRAFDGVDIVVHAAAMKQIDACSYNPAEAVKTNVIGAMNVIDAAIDCGVRKVLALSTDKACEPTTLYGKSKACLEGLMRGSGSYAGHHRTVFACARYGNVFCSRGSVVPFFERLMEEGRPLTITSERMTRFHMRLDQAVDFVLRSLAWMKGGEVFIPKLRSFRIMDLVAAMGAEETTITGIRPNEKIHEMMLGAEESREAQEHVDHFILGGSQPNLPDGFSYSSGNNPDVMTTDDLRAELRLERAPV